MNPLIIFDYIYIRIVNFYGKLPGYRYSNAKYFSSIMVLSLIQFVNILSLLKLFRIEDALLNTLHIYLYIIIFTILLCLNSLRYIKLLDVSSLEYKWAKEKGIRKQVKGVLILIYFSLSFFC